MELHRLCILADGEEEATFSCRNVDAAVWVDAEVMQRASLQTAGEGIFI
jgi:hypothetical protein